MQYNNLLNMRVPQSSIKTSIANSLPMQSNKFQYSDNLSEKKYEFISKQKTQSKDKYNVPYFIQRKKNENISQSLIFQKKSNQNQNTNLNSHSNLVKNQLFLFQEHTKLPNQTNQLENLHKSFIKQTNEDNIVRTSFYKKLKSPQNIKLDNRHYFSSGTSLIDSFGSQSKTKQINKVFSPSFSPKIIQKASDLNNKGYAVNRKYSEDQKQKNIKKEDEKYKMIKKQDQKSTVNTQDRNSVKIPKFLQKFITENNNQKQFVSPKISKQKITHSQFISPKISKQKLTHKQFLSPKVSLQKPIPISNSSCSDNQNNLFTNLRVANNSFTEQKPSTPSYKQSYNNNFAKPINMFSKKKNSELNSDSFAKTANTPQNPPTKIDHPNFQFGRLSSPSSFNNRKRNESSAPIKKQFSLKDFQILNKIGKGAFGEVYLAKQVNLGLVCVLKKVTKKKIKQQKLEQNILRQIKIQSYLKHKHLTQIFGYFDDQEYLYLILELLPDGSLNYTKRKKKVPEIQTSRYIKQICQGLRYMHKQDIIHRDLKPQNIFINQDYLKIGDFGCAVFTQTLRRTLVGCLAYISPEQLNNDLYDDKIDVWCIGILTYQLITGKAPFEEDIVKISRHQKQPKLPELKFPDDLSISQNGKDFIKRLLQTHPEDRMTIQQAMRHPFITKILELDRKQEQEVYGMYQYL